jgi:hypothetical protein
MAMDQNGIYATALAITGDTNSNNVIDHGANTYHGIGPRPLYIPILVTEAFTDTGSNSTAEIVFQSSQYEGFNSSITNTVIASIPTNAATGLLACPIMPPLGQDQQYSRLTTVVSGGNFTAGKISAWISPDPDIVKNKVLGYTGPTTA